MKKIHVICPTYRSADQNDLTRLIGPVSLIQQMASQDFEGDIKIAIIDSSLEPHPFFSNVDIAENDSFVYLHVPDRNAVSKEIKTEYPFAINFIPTDEQFTETRWKKMIRQCVSWDRFLPWDDGYPMKETLEEQIYKMRPTVGMKRNFAIAALAEKFGEPDLVVYADDDDFRSNAYIREATEGIGEYDFTRMLKYFTFSHFNNGQNIQWGLYDVDFEEDANGNWLPPEELWSKELKNSLGENAEYSMTIGKKFSKLKSLAFPPISFEGALHVFKFSLWKRSVREFGGVPITSLCEDVFFFKKCKEVFGEKFKAKKTDVVKPSFIRLANGDNASVIEWTEDMQEQDVPQWACDVLRPLQVLQSSGKNLNIDKYLKEMATAYNKTRKIRWSEYSNPNSQKYKRGLDFKG